MSEGEGCVRTQVLTTSFGDCVGMEGRDVTIQRVGPRILQAELACYMALLDVTYIFLLLSFAFCYKNPLMIKLSA